MPEQELNLAAAKFISSLTKSLQILCNGQVDFTESIELVGHINVKVDHRFKFDYIVDEQVSKEEDSSTTFLSNSYHSHPPSKQTSKKLSPSELDQQDIFSDIPETFQRKTKQSKSTSEILDQHNVHAEDTSSVRDESSHNYSVSVECQGKQPMVVKLEEGEDSNDCMVLPVSPGNYSVPGDGGGTEAFPIAGPSGSFEDSEGGLSNLPRKRRKVNEKGADNTDEGKTIKGQRMMTRQQFHKPKAVFVEKKNKTVSPEQFKLVDQHWTKSSIMYHCNKCSYSTTYRHRVREHCRSVHLGIPRKYKGNEKGHFVCDKCGKSFTSSRGFQMHTLSKHFNKYPYKCHHCSKGFLGIGAHRDHMNMHAGIALQCIACNQIFYTEYGLKRHMDQKHS